MIDLNIQFSDPGDNLPRQLCIDSITLSGGGDWLFTDMIGGSYPPEIGWQVGGILTRLDEGAVKKCLLRLEMARRAKYVSLFEH